MVTPTAELTFDDYQKGTLDTAQYQGAGSQSLMAVLYTALGLANEAGEVLGVVKKALRDTSAVFDIDVALRTLLATLGPEGEQLPVDERLRAAQACATALAEHLQGAAPFSPETMRQIYKETGDTLWYAARFADETGLSLASVANGNRAHLLDRQARGVIGGSGDDR